MKIKLTKVEHYQYGHVIHLHILSLGELIHQLKIMGGEQGAAFSLAQFFGCCMSYGTAIVSGPVNEANKNVNFVQIEIWKM